MFDPKKYMRSVRLVTVIFFAMALVACGLLGDDNGAEDNGDQQSGSQTDDDDDDRDTDEENGDENGSDDEPMTGDVAISSEYYDCTAEFDADEITVTFQIFTFDETPDEDSLIDFAFSDDSGDNGFRIGAHILDELGAPESDKTYSFDPAEMMVPGSNVRCDDDAVLLSNLDEETVDDHEELELLDVEIADWESEGTTDLFDEDDCPEDAGECEMHTGSSSVTLDVKWTMDQGEEVTATVDLENVETNWLVEENE